MRQENWIRGNTRTVRRQYAARKRAIVRVLPGIAGYCRVVGPGKKVDGQSDARPHPGLLPQEKEPPAVARRTGSWSWACSRLFSRSTGGGGTLTVRLGSPGSPWERINFFSGRKNEVQVCGGNRNDACKWLIFRQLSPFLTFLCPFLSRKGLVSRRL